MLFRLVGILSAAAALAAAADLRVAAGDRLASEFAESLTREAGQYWTARRAKVNALKTRAEVEERQQEVRKWLVDAMGGFPRKTPLNAKVTGGFTRDGYRVEHVVFESMPKFYVTANVYVPLNAKPPFPAVVGTAGHSDTGKAIATYQYAWIGMAKRGFLVVAFDPPGQGERSEYLDRATGKSVPGPGTRQHDMAGTQCLLTGSTFSRYETWDGIRALDYLLTRPDVDPKRIGVAGNSGGGTQSAYLAVVEPRLATSVISCYMTGWEQLWTNPGPQDAEQVFPGFLRAGFDFGDYMIAFAPRPVTMLTGIRDFFPIAGGRATYSEVKRVFGVLDAEARAGYFEYDDEHGWHKPRREATYRWLTKWLQGRDDDGAEPEIQTEPEKNLNVTKTGQVQSSLGGETVRTLNLARAQEQFGARQALRMTKAEELRESVKRLLNVPARTGVPAVSEVETGQTDGRRWTKLLIETQPGVHVAAVLLMPAGTGKHGARIVIDSSGKDAAAGVIEELAQGGQAVLAMDPSGWGESALAKGASGYSAMWQVAQRAMLIGRPLPGIQAYDVLRVFDFLRTRGEIDSGRIGITGVRNGGVIAMYAAALEPRIASVEARETVASYMTVARAVIHENMIGIVAPGVLRHFDLPDLALAIAPRELKLRSMRDAAGKPMERGAVEQEYSAAAARYSKAKGTFAIVD